jgi:hypothetical protein
MARRRRRRKNPAGEMILKLAVLGVIGLGVYLGVTGKSLPMLLTPPKQGSS